MKKIRILCNVVRINQCLCNFSNHYERFFTFSSRQICDCIFEWHFNLQQKRRKTSETCDFNREKISQKKYYAKLSKCFFLKAYWVLWSYHWRRRNSYKWTQIENDQKLIVVANDSWYSIIFNFLFLLSSFHRELRYDLRFLVRFDKKNKKSQIQICDYNFYDSKCFRINQEYYVFRQSFCSIRYFSIFHHRDKCFEFWTKSDVLSNKIKRHWAFDCF